MISHPRYDRGKESFIALISDMNHSDPLEHPNVHNIEQAIVSLSEHQDHL